MTTDASNETYARRARARELYATGTWTMLEIGREIGVSAPTVRKYVRGMPPNKDPRSITGRAQAAKNRKTKTSDQVAVRTAQAMQMRLQGNTIAFIAEILQLDPRTVKNDIQRALDETVSPKVLEYRELESARLDYYLTRLQPKIEAGDTKAIQTAINISVRRARLHGLDSPVRIDMVKTEITQEDLAVQELIREAQMRNAAVHQRIVDAQVVGDDPDVAA